VRGLAAVVLAVVVAVAAPRADAQATLGPTPTSTARIEVTGAPGLESTARKLEAAAGAELERISADLVDLPAPQAIHVHLVRDAKDLAGVAPPGRSPPPWAIGVAYPDLGVIDVAMRRGSQIVDPLMTLRHELGHIALGAALGDRAPHWLHEGFAYQHSAEWSWDRSETLAGMVWFGGVIPLDELDRSFPAEESPANRAYAESYDFVGYLSRRGRWEDTADDGDRWPFRNFLTAVGHGADLDTAAIHAFGRPIHTLFEEWREGLTKRYLTAPIGLLGLAVWILCAVLLTFAWWRRRRVNHRRIAQWERDERARDDDLARLRPAERLVIIPPYVPWPGEDPFADVEDDAPREDPDQVN
jgi:hypothetical protein